MKILKSCEILKVLKFYENFDFCKKNVILIFTFFFENFEP